MTKRAGGRASPERLREIYSTHFDKEMIRLLKTRRVELDGSTVAKAAALTVPLLKGLFERRYCAIHIPGFHSATVARRASRWLLAHSRPVVWYIPNRRTGVKTDMAYGIGVPRQVAAQSKEAARQYVAGAVSSMRKVRRAFAPELSPMDKLRLELDELWPGGLKIEPFAGKNGFAGLVRIMKPATLLKGVSRTKGACHVDEDILGEAFSANIYTSVPRRGGELRIWNVKLGRKTALNPAYFLIRHHRPFDPDIQEIIHDCLPAPRIIKPKAGDLVILDASRPHAVGGFDRGCRISIQSFLGFRPPNRQLTISS